MKKTALILILSVIIFSGYAGSITNSIAQDVDTIASGVNKVLTTTPEGGTVQEWIAWVMGSVIAVLTGLVLYFKNKYGKKK